VSLAPSTRDKLRDATAAQLLSQRGTLLRYVSKLLAPDLHSAEDIVQEAMLRAWLHAERLDWQDRPIRQWLFRIAYNLAVDAWRKDRAIPVGLAAEAFADPVGGGDPADTVVDRRFLVAAMGQIPASHREVLVQVHLLGRSGAEVARVLGVPRGTVKSRTHHAVRSLREELARTAA
jgi:RNA polymerase sigma-70 factor (ECF subfamily)